MAGGPPPPPLGAGTTGGYYAPPPPPKRKMSPWAWVGIGCGLFTLLGLGGCFALFNVIRNSIQQDLKQPTTPQAVAASLGVPIYPGANLNTEMTRIMRATFGVANKVSFGKVKISCGVYGVPGIAPGKLAAWYATKLKAAGWKTMPRPPAGFNNRQQGITEQSQYAKGDQQVVVQIGSASAMRGGKNGGGGASGSGASGDGPKTSGGGSTLILTAVKGAGRVD